MNALVGYESSSDESEPVTEKVEALEPSYVKAAPESKVPEASSNAPGPTENIEATLQPVEVLPVPGPILGPDRGQLDQLQNGLPEPEEEINGAIDQGSPSTPLSPYSAEKDTLRALTQTKFMSSSIPPSPPGSPNPAANAKFARFLELKAKGVHFNEDLAGKSSFQNPSLLTNMLARAGITEEEQYVSTVPSDFWSVDIFPPWAYKEGLLQQQRDTNKRLEAEKKAESAAGKRTIEFLGAGASKSFSKSSTPGAASSQHQQLGTPSKRKRP